MMTNLQVRVRRHATGVPQPSDFELVEAPIPHCPDDGVLVEIAYASVDPAMRGWLSAEANYLKVAVGEVMRGHGVGRIVESRAEGWNVGDAVFGWLGWQRIAAVARDALLWKVDLAMAPAEAWLGVLGLNGLTAWVGLHHFGRPKPGETVMVSTAAGGVGSAVGQLARRAGLRAVGLTGTPDKVERAVRNFGYGAAIDYRGVANLSAAIATACPDGIDIFFDNTAGAIADAVFPVLRTGARIIQCGTASVSTWLPPPVGPRRERDLLVKRLSWHGFVVFDHVDLFPRAFEELIPLVAAGELHSAYHILEGLEAAPAAIALLYQGQNHGRAVIRIAPL